MPPEPRRELELEDEDAEEMEEEAAAEEEPDDDVLFWCVCWGGGIGWK